MLNLPHHHLHEPKVPLRQEKRGRCGSRSLPISGQGTINFLLVGKFRASRFRALISNLDRRVSQEVSGLKDHDRKFHSILVELEEEVLELRIELVLSNLKHFIGMLIMDNR